MSKFWQAILRLTTMLFLFTSTFSSYAVVPAAAASPLPVTSAAAPMAPAAPAAPASCGAGCSVTIDARDFTTGAALANFNYIINVDNTKLPDDPMPSNTESNSPIVREGGNDRPTVSLPDGRYLISVRSPNHKMWGKHITLPDDAADNGTLVARIDMTETGETHPLPLGKIRVFVFEDNAWANGAPDTEEGGLGGFEVGLEEQTGSAVTVDYNNNPICGGICITSDTADTLGFVQIDDLGPATYFIDVHPPEGPCNADPTSQWYQTTTIDGGLNLQAGVEEGADGTGAPGEQLWEPANIRTAYWFGFVCSPQAFDNPGTGEIVGTARNWLGWPPFDVLTLGEPVADPFIALSDSTTDRTVYVGQGDGAGNFDIQNVPAGSYNMAIWDEQLSYIFRFETVTVGNGQFVSVDTTDALGNTGIGVSRWFGWLDGYVFNDLNQNGVMDPDEPGISNTDVDQRWRDGSIKEGTITGPDGYYEYPTAEGGALGKWIINEQGFGQLGVTGASVHDEYTGAVTHVPTDLGGALLSNQLLTEGHRATVDWGKFNYDTGVPGQIVGITYWATTRNEFEAYKQAHEDYEPGIPDVTVLLETLGPDLLPNTADDVVVNSYSTDHWKQPNIAVTSDSEPTFRPDCAVTTYDGSDISSQVNSAIGPNCLEVPITGEQSKDGAFDGGYAFADYCPSGIDLSAPDPDNFPCWNPAKTAHIAAVPLVAGTYITHVIMPKDGTDPRLCNPAGLSQNISEPKGSVPGGGAGCLYRVVREEDVNVDLGNQYAPLIPPPPCVGDDHVLDQKTLVNRSFYFGDPTAHAPLCDKHLVVLENGQNANADFNMMTNFRTDPNGEDPTDTHIGDVAEPGRIIGLVSNDIYFETNPQSIWYGEPRPIAGIPVGIYQRVDVENAGCANSLTTCITGKEIGRDGPTAPTVTYDANNWRLFTTVWTSPEGTYEALLPSTETYNCPIPQGPCPGMYLFTVNDPGTAGHPNAGYNPNILTATSVFDVWPGLTDQLDTPLDPISGTACEDPAVPARPSLLQVSRPYVLASNTGTARRITITADFIGTAGPTGATGGHVNLTDVRTGTVTTLTRANGGVVSWTVGTSGTSGTPDTIVIQIPAINTSSFRPGPKQLTIVSSNANGGVSSVVGITIHVLGSNGTGAGLVTYTPNLVLVGAPPVSANSHVIQTAVDAAPAGSLLVLGAGTYNENVLVWKPLKLQGLGPGGIIGAHELQARDPEDPRFKVSGTVIDGRYFAQNASTYDATVTAHAPYAVDPTLSAVLRGADVTFVAQSAAAYNVPASGATVGVLSASRLDGVGLMTGRGEGAGGVQLQANINNLQVTNNVLENNGGVVTGGIGLGQPFAHASHNYNVRMANNSLIGNGGLTTSGGIGIFYGSNNYEVASSVICSNFSVEYGAGISHIGLSPNGNIHDNQIYYNESVDAGAGIAIESELVVGGATLGDGSGAVNIDKNLIQSNYSSDDGGGIFILDALTAPINIRDNMIVDNGAADLGGAILLDDSSNVRIMNNTIANNVSTASSENSDGLPHGAGLTSEANDPAFQAMLGPARVDTGTTTNGSYIVNDTSITAADLGKDVSATGIPVGSMILSVTPGANFRMSLAATATGSRSLTIAPADFSNPVALFNNIFWNNNAFTLSQPGPGATLVNQGFIDFEIFGTTNINDTFTPRYSSTTNNLILGPNGLQHALPGNQGNLTGVDPLFVSPFILELTVTGSRLDPQMAAVTITGADPPVGITSDYHLQGASPVQDQGVRCSNSAVPAPVLGFVAACSGGSIQAPAGTLGDFDGQLRPQIRTVRGLLLTPWDLGADELLGVPVVGIAGIEGMGNNLYVPFVTGQ